jgi:two-component system sensor histidine kinase KdpD
VASPDTNPSVRERPDPDELLSRVKAEEARARRGKLKIFFGAAPGVGKTYSMLEAGRKLAKDGLDVVVGYVEPHSRPETQALVLGLDLLPRIEIAHRGVKLLEFDLNAALALRPQVLLVDELAHTNAPGLTHAKRWQDVAQLLDAGIDVYTTLNVQHLESLNDVVAQISGVTVRETVPDSLFDNADEVELVDLAPDDLLERLREGKIYIPREAQRATEHFFAKGNLIALRELALRRTAERVGAQMDVYREEHRVVSTWPARERLLVCVGPSPFAARLVRATHRMAASLHAPWIALHVETPDDSRMSRPGHDYLKDALHLAEQLGGETAMLSGTSVADELLHYAQSRNATRIVVGKPKQPRWKEWLRGSLVYELTRRAGDIDIYVISGTAPSEGHPAHRAPPARRSPLEYLWSVAAVLVCTGVSWMLSSYLAPTNLVMIYLVGVVVVSLRLGRGPSILTAVLGVLAFDFFFIPPQLTFAVRDTQYLLTFLVMLATGVVIGTLTNRVRFQVESARKRERRTAALYSLSRELTATQGREQIARVAAEHVAAAAEANVVVLLADTAGKLASLGATASGFELNDHEQAVADWVRKHGQTAGRGTHTLPGAEALYLPLSASHGTVGVLGVRLSGDGQRIDQDPLHLLEVFAGLIGLAIERADLAKEAERIGLQMETERLRSSLLSAVSHDLRTPLSVITGAASTLLEGDASLAPQVRRELLTSVLNDAERLNRLVANLLDMTRLEAGALEVHKQWQLLEEIIGAALGRLARQLENHPVTTRLSPDLPMVPMDELLVQQVLVNLLENAAKYAPPGSPLEISAVAAGDAVCVEVADRGPGLMADELERVFEKFYRTPDSSGRPGAGLGLAICRGIIELHGGKIHAENRPGGGAVFRFTLPLVGKPPELPAEPHPV